MLLAARLRCVSAAAIVLCVTHLVEVNQAGGVHVLTCWDCGVHSTACQERAPGLIFHVRCSRTAGAWEGARGDVWRVHWHQCIHVGRVCLSA